ncbi:MAG: 3'(2'),5'-bisphosphate nucleotidase CysQ [Pseudomonadota bacterium]
MHRDASHIENLLEPVLDIARAAGRGIMAVYATDFGVVQKTDHSPLTAADMAAHHTIMRGLAQLTPDLPVLSEEAADVPFAQRAAWRRYWLVDPLDGTREFINRNGDFTVNIALIEDQRPVLGVVHAPVSGVCYFARAGGGAYKQDNGAPQAIRARRWDGGPCTVVGSRSHGGDSLKEFLANLGDYEILSMGSSLKSCLVAEGKADIYPRLGPTSEWDTAAAQCIVEEAGGRVTDTAMRPLRYNTRNSLINPHFFVFGDCRQDWTRFLAKT